MNFIRVHISDESSRLINLDLVTCIKPFGNGSRIFFIETNDYLDVMEKFDYLENLIFALCDTGND